MSAPKNIAEAISGVRMLDAAWVAFAHTDPGRTAPQDEQDAWDEVYEVFSEASDKMRVAAREMPCGSLAETTTKLSWLLEESKQTIDDYQHSGFSKIAADLVRFTARPTQDAFAVKLARYHEAFGRRDTYEAAHRPADGGGLTLEWEAFEKAMSPLHTAVFDAGRAVLLEPAPDMAALLDKRAIFDALEFWSAGDEPEVFSCLFADAIAFAGGAA